MKNYVTNLLLAAVLVGLVLNFAMRESAGAPAPAPAYTIVPGLSERRLSDPLLPPERSYSSPGQTPPLRPSTPINVSTRGEPTQYQQVGVLIEQLEGGDKRMLPLYGSKIQSQKWNYYANTEGFQSVKLPIYFKNRNCQDDIGCDEIYDTDGDVRVEGYERPFRATIYRLDKPRYIPN